jgi:hypothetical protein
MCSAQEIVECYRRAEEARLMAKAALTPSERADLVEVENDGCLWRAIANAMDSQRRTATRKFEDRGSLITRLVVSRDDGNAVIVHTFFSTASPSYVPRPHL